MGNEYHKIVFATNNLHKISEARKILGDRFNLLSLSDIDYSVEIPEDYDTIEENALQKAGFIYKKFSLDCFADDTGLEVDALKGAPGVFSARYAGHRSTYADNVNKLLANLEGKTLRTAQFRTVIALILKGKEYLFDGVVKGEIITKPRGEQGFGYDPIFQPLGYSQTFAEMPIELKNSLSHRGIALRKLADFFLSLP